MLVGDKFQQEYLERKMWGFMKTRRLIVKTTESSLDELSLRVVVPEDSYNINSIDQDYSSLASVGAIPIPRSVIKSVADKIVT